MEEKKIPELETENEKEKEINADEIVKSIFNRQDEKEEKSDENGKKTVKKPINIFSRPINVLQTEDAKKSRIKNAVIEGLIFGAFITSVTAIYSLSGLDLKLSPESSMDTPSLFFFFAEFVVFSILISIGDFFLTEKRVNDYNQQVAGLAFDVESEIEKALMEQEKEGITPEDAAAANKTNGEEAPEKPFIEIRPDPKNEESLTDKAFEAYIADNYMGKAECCKGVILDKSGLEHILLKITKLESSDEMYANGVAMELIGAFKEVAVSEGFVAVSVSESVYGDLEFALPYADKFNIKTAEKTKISESFPGSLMGISGELK